MPTARARSDGMELEAYVNREVKALAHITHNATTEFGLAISGYTVHAPWADVPARLLARIGFMPREEAERRKMYDEASPEARGFREYGADWLAEKWDKETGRLHVIVGQTKDHAKLRATCLGRFLLLGGIVAKFNLEQGWPEDMLCMALCYPEDSRISRSDLRYMDKQPDSRKMHRVQVNGFVRSAPRPADPANEDDGGSNGFVSIEPTHTLGVQPTPTALAVATPAAVPATQPGAWFSLKGLNHHTLPKGAQERLFQVEAARRVRDCKGNHLVEAPPGAGKTYIMCLAMGYLLARHSLPITRRTPEHKPVIALVVAPFIDLCEQFIDKATKTLELQLKPSLGKDWHATGVVKVYTQNGGSIPRPDLDEMKRKLDGGARVFVATEASAYLLCELADYAKSKGFALLTMKDEAHYCSNDDANSMKLMGLTKKHDEQDGEHYGVICTATPTDKVLKVCDYSGDEGAPDQAALKMKLDQAISLGICRPYEIILPLMTSKEAIENDGLPVDVEKLAAEDALGAGVLFTVSEMLDTGARRCIVYGTDHKQAEQIHEYLHGACALYGVKCESRLIVDKTKGRQNRYDAFATEPTSKNDGQETQEITLQFLVAVSILDFGIDIPECDSISVPAPPTCADDVNSAHRLIQRMGRAMRGKHGTARVFLFADENSDWLKKVSKVLRDFDPECEERIVVRSFNPVNKYTREMEKIEFSALKTIKERYDFSGKRVEKRKAEDEAEAAAKAAKRAKQAEHKNAIPTLTCTYCGNRFSNRPDRSQTLCRWHDKSARCNNGCFNYKETLQCSKRENQRTGGEILWCRMTVQQEQQKNPGFCASCRYDKEHPTRKAALDAQKKTCNENHKKQLEAEFAKWKEQPPLADSTEE